MFRFFVVVACLGLLLGPVPTWATDIGVEAVENFLRHRNVLLSVDFAFGSHKLSEKSCQSLDRIVVDLKALLADSKVVRIEGYATPQGEEDYNLILSMQRAMAVQEYLQRRHGFEIDLYFNGYGSSKAPPLKRVELAFYDDTLGLTVADIDSTITK